MIISQINFNSSFDSRFRCKVRINTLVKYSCFYSSNCNQNEDLNNCCDVSVREFSMSDVCNRKIHRWVKSEKSVVTIYNCYDVSDNRNLFQRHSTALYVTMNEGKHSMSFIK